MQYIGDGPHSDRVLTFRLVTGTEISGVLRSEYVLSLVEALGPASTAEDFLVVDLPGGGSALVNPSAVVAIEPARVRDAGLS